jgi:DNA polymerase III epsilon subunit-like protein
MSTIVVFDTETGGVMPQHPTIQLAAIAVDESEWKEIDSFQVKIRFDEAAADPEALRMNHYDPEVWKKEAVPPSDAARQFAQWVRPHCSIEMVSKRTGNPYTVAKLAGYNALTFDLPRLRELFGTAFFPCSYHVRDILQRAMFWYDEHPEEKRPESLKLGTVCAYFGIEVDGAHDALADARMTAALAKRLRG